MSDVIALIFDFDDTLAPDSTSGFLDSLGVDTQQFWTKRVDPLLAQDWDPVPAYLHEMIALSREGQHGAITREKLQQWGKTLPYIRVCSRYLVACASKFVRRILRFNSSFI